MPDRMTTQPPAGSGEGSLGAGRGTAGARWRTPAAQAVATVALFGLVGAGSGWVWWSLWAPAPDGVVASGEWLPVPGSAGTSAEFAGTGWYVVVAVVAGLVLGLVVGLALDRAEVVTLVAVTLGSVLAAWLMYRVGLHFSPPDPDPGRADRRRRHRARGASAWSRAAARSWPSRSGRSSDWPWHSSVSRSGSR